MNDAEFFANFGMTIDEAQEILDLMRDRNANEISELLAIASTKPKTLREQLVWANRCASCKKIASQFIRGQT